MADPFDAFSDFRMQGHNVVLTGGAQNIGAGIAKTLAGAGANVMIADLQGDKAQETAARISAETGGRCLGMGCDVTRAEDLGMVMTSGYADAGVDAAVQEKLMHPDNLTGRTGKPQDLANAMLWLCSPAGSWVSGQVIKVHGGGSVVRLFGS